jgi:iron complex outermembrane recepter protein
MGKTIMRRPNWAILRPILACSGANLRQSFSLGQRGMGQSHECSHKFLVRPPEYSKGDEYMIVHKFGRLVRSRGLLLSSAIACYSLGAAPLAAQQVEAENPKTTVGEIVVTAQKRLQTVNKAALAVTALGPVQLQETGTISMRDVTTAAPSVQVHTIGPVGFMGITIRGVSNQDFSQRGSPAVATYIDGIYVGVSQLLSGSLFDLERMEILRGPQGTTYGQNATGGNVNLITATPKNKFEASANASYGNYNDIHVNGMINLPVSDTFALRGAVMMHRSDGFFDTKGTTARNYAAYNEFGGRLTGLWTPSSAFKWKLVLEGYRNRGTPSNVLTELGANGKPISGNSPYDVPFVGPHAEPNVNLTGYSIRSRMDLNLSDSLSLAYVAGYQHMRSSFVFGLAGANNREVYDGDWEDRVKAYSNEVNLNFDSGPFKNILGISQFHKIADFDEAFHSYRLGTLTHTPGSVEQSTIGVFNQSTLSITEALRAIAGVRWSRESQNTQKLFYRVSCPIADVPFSQIFQQTQANPGCPTPLAMVATPYAKGTWKKVSWKGGLEFDVNKDTLAYLSVTNGFKSGQVNPGLPPPLPSQVGPEEVINYEAGIKSILLDRKLNVRVAVFNEDYKDVQVSNVQTVGFISFNVTTNAGAARIYGAEVELDYLVTPDDHLSGFVSYTHARYTKFNNAQDGSTKIIYPSLAGNYLANSPDLSIRVQYSHDFHLGNGGLITPMAAVYYQTKQYLREFNLPIDKQGGYTKTNLSLTYKDPSRNWTASAFVTNLENKSVRNTVNTAQLTYFSDYLPPRQFGVRLGYEF